MYCRGKAVVNSRGTRIGPDGTVSRVLGPAKENNYALVSPKGYIVLGVGS
jgi:rRNA processing protein Gar1